MHGGKVADDGRFSVEYMMADKFGWSFEQTRATPSVAIHEFMHRISQAAEWENRRRNLNEQIAKSKQKR